MQLHAATRGNVGWLTDTSLLPERKMHANLLFFRCTQPEVDGSLEYSLRLSTGTGRKPNSEERRSLFFGKHIYRLNSPLTAVDPVDPQIPSRPNPPGSVSLWFYAVHRAYS